MTKKKTLVVTQVASPIRRPKIQRAILKGLGLFGIGQTRELEDTSSIRGMIAKVSHMVKVADNA
ncbi:50S ribosomal protein L30 [Candidatus Bealeia paramacronuclearis]|uniref:Large ribosomal subunit protein uL30 n=1 Tax=Candidatus Bealeia paramacronuclearis TaxID=1921001 RepID=A0ABZ2C549_9PROT|nr:50S ribosomal protein L30 [Candidatus Bealeia paramacronuclearis]